MELTKTPGWLEFARGADCRVEADRMLARLRAGPLTP